MSVIRSIETRIARLVEGTFGKVFRTNVQPVELARRLVKEMDGHAQRTVTQVYVPNIYDVYLSRDDHRNMSTHAAALCGELAEYLLEHARTNGYALPTRPRVTLHLDRDLELGSFGIATGVEHPRTDGAPLPADAPAESPAEHTMVFQAAVAPVADIPAADSQSTMALLGPGGPYVLKGTRVTVGRGRLNDIVLSDASVSREHAELVCAGPDAAWKVRDLDSTNGVDVNGSPVRENALSAGDTVTFGSAVMRFDRFNSGAS